MSDRSRTKDGAPDLAAADTLAGDAATVAPVAAPISAATLPVVDRACYVVGEEHARGGLGRILRARDRRTGRPVAIKELLDKSPGHLARFVREAMVTANLQHPAIVPVYEVGRWPEGDAFFAMKLVTGRSLEAAIGAAATLAERLALLPHALAVADALAYAHGQGVIHRDLKPANVLVGAFGETVVIDWGLARRAGDPSPEEPATAAAVGDGMTVAGAVMGTPAFMPPEQARGETVDARADVYALGGLLYHLLAGVPPYGGRASSAAVLAAVLGGPPVPLESVQPGLPADLLAIVAKAMARAPADRYPSARELAADLRRFLAGRLVEAHRYSLAQLLGRWLRRYRLVVGVVAVALVALGALGAVSVRRIVQARTVAEHARTVSEMERLRAQAEKARAEAEQQKQRAEEAEQKLTEENKRVVMNSLRQRNFSDVQECYSAELARVSVAGQLELALAVDGGGKLADVKVTATMQLVDRAGHGLGPAPAEAAARLSRCVEDKARRWELDVIPAMPEVYHVPFVLRPAD